MPFRSVRCSFRPFAKVACALSLFVLLGVWGGTQAFAASMTIQSKSFSDFYIQNGAQNGTPVTSPTAYYSTTDTSGNPGFDTGAPFTPFHDPDNTTVAFGELNITKTQASEAGALSNAISFSFNSTFAIAPGNGQTAVLVVAVAPASGTTSRFAPIAGINGVPLSAGGGNGCISLSGVTANNHCFAIAYSTGQTPTIQMYPKDICTDFAALGGPQALGCDNSQNVIPANPTSNIGGASQQITFQLVYVDGNGVIQNPTAPLDQQQLNLSYQQSMQPLNCPAAINYFPGDSSINVDTSPFTSTNTFGAPVVQVIAVGKLYSGNTAVPPVEDGTFINPAVDDFYARTGIGPKQPVGPMINSTDGTDNAYTVAFMIRDASGMINPGTAACTQGPVQSSLISTFLNRSKCFIATAAFRSTESAPVMLLRRFRDEVLVGSPLGDAFVQTYYRWSPPAAEWLMEHPRLRYPILGALAPVELGAWVALQVAGAR